MFRSDREYSGLDDFFQTSIDNSLRGLTAIKERIKDSDSLYSEWQYNPWNFISDSVENDFLRNEVWVSIETMRSGSINYIMGEFNLSIVASSAAVERICNVISYIDFRQHHMSPDCEHTQEEWIKVDTVHGPVYYTENWDKIIKTKTGYIIYKNKTLGHKLLHNVEKCSYECSYLLNPGDTICNNVFVERRNAAAHGDFSRLPLIEQRHGYIISDPDDLSKLMGNKNTALDQYGKASKFIVNVINKFNKEYTSSKKKVS